MYALGKAHIRSTTSLRSFPNFAFETVSMFVWLTMASLSFFQGRSSSASSLHASLLQAIDGVMSLALCQQVMSHAPQHLISSAKQATCEGCFVSQRIRSVLYLHSGMSRAVHPQGFNNWVLFNVMSTQPHGHLRMNRHQQRSTHI